MSRLQWTMAHAVHVPEMDGEHREIFASVAELKQAIEDGGDVRKLTKRLLERTDSHFAHEERLMRAARYDGLPWHKQQHDGARKRAAQLARAAAPELVDYLSEWLHDHTRVADMMLAAFLRNHRRGLYKVTFRAGTRGAAECEWLDSRGETFEA